MRTIHTALSGRMKVAVLSDGKVTEERPWEKNLILNQGLDKVATVVFNQLFAACAIGDNNSPTTIDSRSTATVSATTLTLVSANYTFTNADLDSAVHFDSGELFTIQSIVNATTVTLFSAGTISTPTHFMILRVNQVQLGNELKRTNVYPTTAGANLVTPSDGSLLLQRTFIFSPETSTVTYKEIGFSDLDVAGPNLFSRVVLGMPVTVSGPSAAAPNGQQLQVTYQLTVNIDYGSGPGNFVPGTNPTTITIAGLPLSFAIYNYAASATGNQLVVSVSPPIPVVVGQTVVLQHSTVAAYNGSWTVQAIAGYADASHGVSVLVTLNTSFSTNPGLDGGALLTDQGGVFFRPNKSIYWINSAGGSSTPPSTPDVFEGFGEPSIAGTAWIASDGAAALGSNGNALAPSSNVQTSACQILSYTPGNYYLDKKASFTVVTTSPIYSFGVGSPDTTNQVQTWVWNEGQALGQYSTLSLTFRFSWGRGTF
jgi:hypothetical protein